MAASCRSNMAGDTLLGDVNFFSVVTVVLARAPCKNFPGLTSTPSVEWRPVGQPYIDRIDRVDCPGSFAVADIAAREPERIAAGELINLNASR
jgi:hypothetical protein